MEEDFVEIRCPDPAFKAFAFTVNEIRGLGCVEESTYLRLGMSW